MQERYVSVLTQRATAPTGGESGLAEPGKGSLLLTLETPAAKPSSPMRSVSASVVLRRYTYSRCDSHSSLIEYYGEIRPMTAQIQGGARQFPFQVKVNSNFCHVDPVPGNG